MDRAGCSSVTPASSQSTQTASPEVVGLDLPGSVLAKASGENFPVASRLLPRRYRRHLMALYGFARLVDDVGDEVPRSERGKMLDAIEDDLDRMYAGAARLPVLQALEPTARGYGIPADPFRALIEANRQDQRVSRYRTYRDLLDYCTLSANPVGHVVLYIFGAATPERMRLSDCICTGLQLVEHWQDVAEDLGRDRVYLPQEDLERFCCAEADLVAPTPARVRELVAFETQRAVRLLHEGAPLVGTLRGFARLAVAGYVAGGRAAAAAIRAVGYDVMSTSPRPRPARVLVEWLRLVRRGR
ncbi:MAG: squalene synthase HpnC [Streptosporangiales bacterium]|nr:squalene synthase HpnC [Streptosporangiales bacterium]